MKRIALFMENSRAYGREMIRGIADLNQTRNDIALEMIEADDLNRADRLREFDGIIARVITREACDILKSANIPVVDVLCQFPDTGFMRADSNHQVIGQQAADFFLSRGYKSFAFFGFKDAAFSNARRDGFIQRLKKEGAPCRTYASETVDYATIFAESTHHLRHSEALARWLKSLPDRTALFCANDIRAYQALCVAEELGLSVPEQLAVLGVDNDPLICAFARPQLSSIDPNAHAVGYAAALILNNALERRTVRSHKSTSAAPLGIIERASTQILQLGPSWLQKSVDFIRANTDRSINTGDVVRLVERSHTAVEKVFQKHLGESVGRYILRTKMNEANRLLAHGNINSKDVAIRVGYKSPQYFCRAYRSFFGFSPTARQAV